jgi:hypothetical protein
MALIKGLFQGISGKVGQVVFVTKGGSTYARRLPRKRESPFSDEELAKQARFALTGRIASRICQVEELKHFWKPIRAQNISSYNRIFKANHNQFDIKKFKGFIYLSSEWGFNLNEHSLKIRKPGLHIACDPLTDYDFNCKNKVKYIIAAGIIILKSPIKENYPEYQIISFKSEKVLFSRDSFIDMKIELKGTELKIWNGYAVKKAFATFITIDDLGNPLRNSQILKSNP